MHNMPSGTRELFLRAIAPEGHPLPMPRTVAVYAHPDDECIALGGRLRRLGEALFVQVTDGAPANGEDARANGFRTREEYRDARQRELDRAFEVAGIPHARRQVLRYTDQSVSRNLIDLTRRIATILAEERPELVFTHPYEGGHPDHDATAFAVHAAIAMMERDGQSVPLMIEGAGYHRGEQGIRTGSFLPDPDHARTDRRVNLLGHEQRRKEALFGCFATQAETLKYFPTSWECFRVAPGYDFTRPPHTPPVFYDGFSWGMTSERFCELSAEAARELAHASAHP